MFLLLSLSESLEGCRAAEWRVQTLIYSFLCEHREDFSSVTKEIYTEFFSSDFWYVSTLGLHVLFEKARIKESPSLLGRDSSPTLWQAGAMPNPCTGIQSLTFSLQYY
jgi:hypothetical protein